MRLFWQTSIFIIILSGSLVSNAATVESCIEFYSGRATHPKGDPKSIEEKTRFALAFLESQKRLNSVPPALLFDYIMTATNKVLADASQANIEKVSQVLAPPLLEAANVRLSGDFAILEQRAKRINKSFFMWTTLVNENKIVDLIRSINDQAAEAATNIFKANEKKSQLVSELNELRQWQDALAKEESYILSLNDALVSDPRWYELVGNLINKKYEISVAKSMLEGVVRIYEQRLTHIRSLIDESRRLTNLQMQSIIQAHPQLIELVVKAKLGQRVPEKKTRESEISISNLAFWNTQKKQERQDWLNKGNVMMSDVEFKQFLAEVREVRDVRFAEQRAQFVIDFAERRSKDLGVYQLIKLSKLTHGSRRNKILMMCAANCVRSGSSFNAMLELLKTVSDMSRDEAILSFISDPIVSRSFTKANFMALRELAVADSFKSRLYEKYEAAAR